MRALVTGAAGVLGQWLMRTAPAGVEVVPVAHRRPLEHPRAVAVDLRDLGAVSQMVRDVGPDVVIHAAYAKDRPSIVDSSGHVAGVCAEFGAALVHVSTEAVFSGDSRVRAETDRPDPVSDYGVWKAEAEVEVGVQLEDAAVVRLPLIISVDPPDHILQATLATDRTTWFTDELRQPAEASELAAALWRIAMLPAAARRGVWHLPGPEVLSRVDIAERLVTHLGLDDGLFDRSPTPAGLRRPRDIRMSAARAEVEIGWRPAPILGG